MTKIILSEAQLKKIVENQTNNDGTYMVLSNLLQMKNDIETILHYKHHEQFVNLVTGEHAWAGDHISTSKDDVQEVANFIRGYFDQKNINEETELNEKCWDGYKQVGSKKKNGKMVPNCVPVSESSSPAQQAAIAINMKKEGKKPKNESYGEIDESKNTPTNPKLWASSLAWARSKYDVCPSAYCNGAAAKHYKSKGGGWRKTK